MFLCGSGGNVRIPSLEKNLRYGSPFENRLYAHSRQGLGMVGLVMLGLLDNFLNPLKLLLAVTNNFPESP
jgi:hypothetical protein